jgi:HSP20 family protein
MPYVAFSKWDPLHDLVALHERLNRLGSADAPGWSPAVDVYETPERFVVSAELPGLSRDDITIEVQQDVLVLRGARPHVERTDARFHRIERGHGAFSRAFRLSAPVDVEAIAADFRDGVLTVLVPKAGMAARRVEVT